MSERPELSASLDAETFRGYYYLKEKLAAFCRRSHLPVSGGKTELIERVADFLDTGTVSRPRTKRKAPACGGTITGSLNTIPTFETSSPITRAEALRKRLPAGSTEKASAGRTATSEPTLKRWMKMEAREAANDSVFFRDRELKVRGDPARAGWRAGDAVDRGLRAGRPVCV